MQLKSLVSVATVLGLALVMNGCVSFDVVKSKTVTTGDVSKKQGAGQVVDTRDGLWTGVVINAVVPLPPLVVKHGQEQTTVWKQNGEVVYSEQTDTRVEGVTCVLMILRCGSSSSIGSWGDFLFGDSGGYH
jgi:hypothetical protein